MEPDDCQSNIRQSLSGRKSDRMANVRQTAKRNGREDMADITEIDKWRDLKY